MYNDKGNTKYLKLLKQNYSSSQDVIREIVNLSAIINLPKGTEFFLSDIHGEIYWKNTRACLKNILNCLF